MQQELVSAIKVMEARHPIRAKQAKEFLEQNNLTNIDAVEKAFFEVMILDDSFNLVEMIEYLVAMEEYAKFH